MLFKALLPRSFACNRHWSDAEKNFPHSIHCLSLQEAAGQRCSLSCPSSYKQPSSDKCEGRPLPFYKTRLCRPCPAGHRRAGPVVFYWDWFNRSTSEPESETPSQSRWHRPVTVGPGIDDARARPPAPDPGSSKRLPPPLLHLYPRNSRRSGFRAPGHV